MTGSYLSNGTRLTFRDTGAGLPVVFLHPTPLDQDYWRQLVDDLAGVRAIVPDFRGHGGSELGTLPVGGFALVPDAPVLTMDRLAADVRALLDHLGIGEALFAGCSIGGHVALELWRQAPERVQGLAFICAKPQPDTEVGLAKRVETIALARSGGIDAIFNSMAGSLVGATAKKRHPKIVNEIRARMKLSVDALVAVQAGLATRPDSVATVATISAPVLAIAGGEDASATAAEMEEFQSAPGGCEFHLLPDAGHFAAYEQPQKVAALLAEWLRQPDA
jgi:pimeloyl-ACP methyl ester carboxylesterase